jgi:hypothetical protein
MEDFKNTYNLERDRKQAEAAVVSGLGHESGEVTERPSNCTLCAGAVMEKVIIINGANCF